ncbi:MAG: hypothetical protein IJP29_07910 [Lachnospiraceae bacterium]|nr:hypothetical protein [Lachnospiraceae bacterium]
MKIRIQWLHSVDLIWIPDIIEKDIQRYQEDFIMWVDGVSFDDKLREGTCFGTEHFVNYLNEWVLTDIGETNEKVSIIAQNYEPETEREKKEFDNMKKLYF